MSNVLTIAGRELRSYILSPLAWIIIAVFAFFTGVIFVQIVTAGRVADLTALFQWMAVLALILAPALTMRLFADEYRFGTIELLLTAPARDWQIVVGKYIAALAGFILLLVPTLWHVLILRRFGDPDLGILATSYLGIILVGAAFLAVGLFTSSLTQNVFVSYMIGFIFLIFLWIADAPANSVAALGPVSDVLGYLALPAHFEEFFRGVIDATHTVYFLSIVVVALFLTTLVVQSRRWR
jgi:ABC-2 type transport system permease protein